MKKPKQLFGNLRTMPIRRQITVVYLLVMSFTVVVCVLLYLRLIAGMVDQTENLSIERALNSVKTDFNTVVNRAHEYSKIIAFNEDVQDALRNAQDGGSRRDLLNANQAMIRLMTGSTFISSAYIFDTVGNMYVSANDYMRVPAQERIEDAAWYRQVVEKDGGYILLRNAGGFFVPRMEGESYVSLVRMINDLNTQQPIGVVLVNISTAKLHSTYFPMANELDMGIVIMGGGQELVVDTFYDAQFPAAAYLERYRQHGQGFLEYRNQKGRYKVAVGEMSEAGWYVIGITPEGGFFNETRIFTIMTFAVIGLNAIFLLLGAFVITRVFSAPISRMLKSMKRVEDGELVKIQRVESNDELNRLQRGYNMMIGQIQTLLHNVIEEQDQRRKYELEVMHAQIRPHFLYNTFDSISALALMGDTEGVYTMVQALGKYYRTSLNKGQELITVEEEIRIVREYLTIQKFRYEDVFEVAYDIDPATLHHKVLKLVVQPFVENAIYHGLKTKGVCGLIRISTREQEDHFRIEIADDGAGMAPAKIQDVMTRKTGPDKSFGIYGTIQRIHLFYKRDNLVTIHSEEGKGTLISIALPKEMEWRAEDEA